MVELEQWGQIDIRYLLSQVDAILDLFSDVKLAPVLVKLDQNVY